MASHDSVGISYALTSISVGWEPNGLEGVDIHTRIVSGGVESTQGVDGTP